MGLKRKAMRNVWREGRTRKIDGVKKRLTFKTFKKLIHARSQKSAAPTSSAGSE